MLSDSPEPLPGLGLGQCLPSSHELDPIRYAFAELIVVTKIRFSALAGKCGLMAPGRPAKREPGHRSRSRKRSGERFARQRSRFPS